MSVRLSVSQQDNPARRQHQFCHDLHSGLGRMPSFHPRRCVTLVFSLTLILACGLTFSGLSPAALPSCANCAVSDDQCGAIVCFPDSDRQSCADETRLWQYVGSLPTYLLNRLQSVLNAAAQSIAGLRRSDHVTDTLASFHWLRAPGGPCIPSSARHCTSIPV